MLCREDTWFISFPWPFSINCSRSHDGGLLERREYPWNF